MLSQLFQPAPCAARQRTLDLARVDSQKYSMLLLPPTTHLIQPSSCCCQLKAPNVRYRLVKSQRTPIPTALPCKQRSPTPAYRSGSCEATKPRGPLTSTTLPTLDAFRGLATPWHAATLVRLTCSWRSPPPHTSPAARSFSGAPPEFACTRRPLWSAPAHDPLRAPTYLRHKTGMGPPGRGSSGGMGKLTGNLGRQSPRSPDLGHPSLTDGAENAEGAINGRTELVNFENALRPPLILKWTDGSNAEVCGGV